MKINSPCIGVCRLNNTGALCLGCGRTLSEIASWSRLTRTKKLRVLTAVEKPKAAPSSRQKLEAHE